MIRLFAAGTVALTAEGASLWLLGGSHPTSMQISDFIYMHVIACAILALIGPSLLPANYRQRSCTSSLFFFAIAFCIPFFGTIGLLFFLVPALWSQRTRLPTSGLLHSWAPELKDKDSTTYRHDPIVGDAQMFGILHYATDQDKRLRALIGTLSLDDQHSIPLLRIALKDSNDEVRLLAYALLARKETEIENQVGELLSRLKTEKLEAQFALYKSLACTIFELAQFQTSDSSVNLMYDRVCAYAEAGLRLNPMDGGLQFLLGRIFLKNRNLSGARLAFHQATECGLDQRKAMPYLAEIAFHEKRFSEIGGYLTHAAQLAEQPFPLNAIAGYWGARHNERPTS